MEQLKGVLGMTHELEHLHAEVEHLRVELAEARRENEQLLATLPHYTPIYEQGVKRGRADERADAERWVRSFAPLTAYAPRVANEFADGIAAGEHVGAAAPINPDNPVNAAPTEATTCRYCGRLMKHHPGGVYCPQPVAPVEQKPRRMRRLHVPGMPIGEHDEQPECEERGCVPVEAEET